MSSLLHEKINKYFDLELDYVLHIKMQSRTSDDQHIYLQNTS